MSSLQAMFADPPARFRPVPFWSWNADLKADELVRQVHLMKEAGLGGFFMHARGGLETEYMGDDWFAVTAAVLDAAKETGMNAWAYDENGWPSGFGDGKVNGLGEAYQLKYFRCDKVDTAKAAETPRVLAVFSPDGKRIAEPEKASGEVLVLHYEINPYYVDNADPKVVKKFLEVIYQAYLDRLPPEKVRHLVGFFTDEPQLSRNGIPYSPALMQAYRKTWGEDLLDRVPELFYDLGEWRRTRVRFWRTVTRCFAEAYSKQIGDWCRAHGKKLTGHMVCEETFESQTPSNGAVMPHYPHFDIPGMDFLGRELHPFTLPLQVWSACAQTGRSQMLTETYAGCGWNVSFDDLRYLLNDQMVRGANLLCPHLESYTLRGIRKRDYPASLFFHQPWWPYYRRFTDYASRVGMLLASGKDPADVLMIHGIASGHMHYEAIRPGVERAEDGPCVQYWQKMIDLAAELDARQCAFHLGDETILAERGSVSADGLAVGLMTYRAAVLPELATLSRNEIELLSKFADAGFPVFAVRNTLDSALYADGVPGGWDGLEKMIRWFDTAAEAAEAVAALNRDLSVRTPSGELCRRIVHTSRLVPDWDGEAAEIHFFSNADREHACSAVIRMRGNSCVLPDPYTGEVRPVAFRAAKGQVEVRADIPAGGELLIAASARIAAAPEISAGPARRTVALPAEATVKRVTENLLTLDRCDCWAEGKLFLADEYILTVQNKLLALKRDLPVKLVFRFTAAADFRPGSLQLLIERPERQTIRVNGQVIPSVSKGFFHDPAFERVDIASAVRPGENVIELERDFTQSEKTRRGYEAAWVFESERNKLAFDTELEAIYLAGDFAVGTPGTFSDMPDDRVRYAGDFVLANPVKTVRLDAVEQSGFPFFAGTMALEGAFTAERDGEPVKFVFAKRRATVCNVAVNRVNIGTLCWHEDGLAVPEKLVKRGQNTFTLELVTSLRNMLGPHHLDCGEVSCGGPGTFYQDRGVFSQRGALPWNRDWCFARTGMAKND